ncbi:hypothetical protein EW146_g1359 [Bondarzewia mesenterica]|uniref:Uncharacterized protein n=1 Tax=Bondarzewia mesenterica TaxID=1095465 RepID=A0A4S4MAD2_9AGAM|nr:hypothetical protein EW146_g1359 [Bondarzewia mesenterica]
MVGRRTNWVHDSALDPTLYKDLRRRPLAVAVFTILAVVLTILTVIWVVFVSRPRPRHQYPQRPHRRSHCRPRVAIVIVPSRSPPPSLPYSSPLPSLFPDRPRPPIFLIPSPSSSHQRPAAVLVGPVLIVVPSPSSSSSPCAGYPARPVRRPETARWEVEVQLD